MEYQQQQQQHLPFLTQAMLSLETAMWHQNTEVFRLATDAHDSVNLFGMEVMVQGDQVEQLVTDVSVIKAELAKVQTPKAMATISVVQKLLADHRKEIENERCLQAAELKKERERMEADLRNLQQQVANAVGSDFEKVKNERKQMTNDFGRVMQELKKEREQISKDIEKERRARENAMQELREQTTKDIQELKKEREQLTKELEKERRARELAMQELKKEREQREQATSTRENAMHELKKTFENDIALLQKRDTVTSERLKSVLTEMVKFNRALTESQRGITEMQGNTVACLLAYQAMGKDLTRVQQIMDSVGLLEETTHGRHERFNNFIVSILFTNPASPAFQFVAEAHLRQREFLTKTYEALISVLREVRVVSVVDGRDEDLWSRISTKIANQNGTCDLDVLSAMDLLFTQLFGDPEETVLSNAWREVTDMVAEVTAPSSSYASSSSSPLLSLKS
jgi:hypothetical protein